MKGTHKHKEIKLIRSDTHIDLSQSEENRPKCMCTRYVYCVFKYIYLLLTEKDHCECRNVSTKFSCVYLCL